VATISISGYDILVDDEDISRIQERHWYVNKAQVRKHNLYYFYNDRICNSKKETITLHRYIFGAVKGDGYSIDHVNGNTLDCRKENLRRCLNRDNVKNSRKRIVASSHYKGISWHTQAKKWEVGIISAGKSYYLGLHDNEMVAARIYDMAALHFFGEYASINFSRDIYTKDDIKTVIEKYRPKLSSKYRGVHSFSYKWSACLTVNKIRYYLGVFPTEEEAAIAYDNKAKELLGKKARLNFE